MSDQPYSFGQARQAEAKATRAQQAAEEFIKDAHKQHAEAERAYRELLAKRIIELRSEGHAITIAKDLARGDKQVAQLMYQAMVAEGVKEAAKQAAWRHANDRQAVQRFVEWSMRRDLAEGYRPPDQPATQTFGRQAA